jgi:peptide deformylase
MAVKDVITLGHPTLRQVAEEMRIDEIDHQIIQDMIDTMHEKDGVGLAAPQINISRRLIVVTDYEKEYVLINPKIIAYSEQTSNEIEGCLSLPGLQAMVNRFEKIIVQALDSEGKQIEITASGLLARVLQHEIDHLNGILYIDRADLSTLVELDPQTEEKRPTTLLKVTRKFKKMNAGLAELVFNRVHPQKDTEEKVIA